MGSVSRSQIKYKVYYDELIGHRNYMEDIISIKKYRTGGSGGCFLNESETGSPFACFFIFDGHGGCEAAKFAEKTLLKQLLLQNEFESDDDEEAISAIKKAFIKTQRLMWEEARSWPKTCHGHISTAGTTVSMVLLRAGKMYVAHVGDSTVVVGEEDDCGRGKWKSRTLTEDHKPDSTKELEGIESRGGEVIVKAGVPRVVWRRKRTTSHPINGTLYDKVPFLAVSRSLGDLWSYNPERSMFTVSPDPDVSVHAIDADKLKCIVLASDGLWNVFPASFVVDVIHDSQSDKRFPINDDNIATTLIYSALTACDHKRLKSDNTSAIVILLEREENCCSEVAEDHFCVDVVPKPSSGKHAYGSDADAVVGRCHSFASDAIGRYFASNNVPLVQSPLRPLADARDNLIYNAIKSVFKWDILEHLNDSNQVDSSHSDRISRSSLDSAKEVVSKIYSDSKLMNGESSSEYSLEDLREIVGITCSSDEDDDKLIDVRESCGLQALDPVGKCDSSTDSALKLGDYLDGQTSSTEEGFGIDMADDKSDDKVEVAREPELFACPDHQQTSDFPTAKPISDGTTSPSNSQMLKRKSRSFASPPRSSKRVRYASSGSRSFSEDCLIFESLQVCS